MQPKVKAAISIVLLIIGMFILLEGSKMAVPGNEMIDMALIVVGAVLVLVYMPLVGDYLEVKFKAPRMINLMPMLLVLGAVLIYQGATRVGTGILGQLLFVILGIALVVGAVVAVFKIKGAGKAASVEIKVTKPKVAKPRGKKR